MGFSIDNHNKVNNYREFWKQILRMYKINSDHGFLYKFHELVVCYETNRFHGSKINNHDCPWAFIR